MKITKMIWIYLVAGIMALVIVILGVARFQQVTEQERLKDELAMVQDRLVGLELGEAVTQKEQLQEKINQETTKLQDNLNIVAKPVNSISGEERLFALARDCKVIITEISASETYDTKLKGIPCTVFPVTTDVTGSTSDLVEFVTRLKTDFINSMVESVDIVVADEADKGSPSATIKLMIYTYKGG